jgi:hypothetical protein
VLWLLRPAPLLLGECIGFDSTPDIPAVIRQESSDCPELASSRVKVIMLCLIVVLASGLCLEVLDPLALLTVAASEPLGPLAVPVACEAGSSLLPCAALCCTLLVPPFLPAGGMYVTMPMIRVLSPGADPAGLTSSSVTIDPMGIQLNSAKTPRHLVVRTLPGPSRGRGVAATTW